VSRYIRQRWSGELAGRSRRDRQPCEYEAYVPDMLIGREITLNGDVAADVADAEAAIARFDAQATALKDTEALARLLLRAESVASSRIEGLEIGPRRLLRQEAAAQLGEPLHDVTATEVLANIDAMAAAVRDIGPGDSISVDDLLAFHRRLLGGTRLDVHAGIIRTEQNWIGGGDYKPSGADFVPPPPEYVEALLDDLFAFCNSDGLPAVAQAAMAHAQFETIHPFVDGNGRSGRALIHLVLRRRGLALQVLAPVSLILATWARDYVDGLTATRYHGSVTSADAHNGTNLWIGRFAAACRRAVDDAASFERRTHAIESEWRGRLPRIRRGSALDLLLGTLPGAPVISATSASRMIERSFPQTNAAIARLVDAGVLEQVSLGRRNRAFEAREIVDAFADLERQLASPGGDTRTSEPARRVPYRRP